MQVSLLDLAIQQEKWELAVLLLVYGMLKVTYDRKKAQGAPKVVRARHNLSAAQKKSLKDAITRVLTEIVVLQTFLKHMG